MSVILAEGEAEGSIETPPKPLSLKPTQGAQGGHVTLYTKMLLSVLLSFLSQLDFGAKIR